MDSLRVVIPSRRQPRQAEFLARAVQSVRAQTVWAKVKVDIVVGLDQGETLARDLCERLQIRRVQSDGESQAAALNAAANDLHSGCLAFLEDDDQWHPRFLQFAFMALRHGDFVSSTQLEVDPAGAVIRINDFPTPSGWVMKAETWARIGNFNPEYRLHLDREWLGRLGTSGTRRVHLLESTAPANVEAMRQVRPWLADLARFGGAAEHNGFLRHSVPRPLITRLVHENSGMAQIATRPDYVQQSNLENQMMLQRFGYLPW